VIRLSRQGQGTGPILEYNTREEVRSPSGLHVIARDVVIRTCGTECPVGHGSTDKRDGTVMACRFMRQVAKADYGTEGQFQELVSRYASRVSPAFRETKARAVSSRIHGATSCTAYFRLLCREAGSDAVGALRRAAHTTLYAGEGGLGSGVELKFGNGRRSIAKSQAKLRSPLI
jgi:hypothetical protein